MDIGGVKKMIFVDFVEYNQMKRRLQAFLDKEDGGVSAKKESEDLSLRKETIGDDITKNIEFKNQNSIVHKRGSADVEVEKDVVNNTPLRDFKDKISEDTKKQIQSGS